MNGFEIQCLPGSALPSEVYDATSGTAYPEEWFFEAIGGGRTDSGITVNSVTALSHGPVWQAVNILAGDVGQLPLHVMKVSGKNREKYKAHPLEWILTSEPNETQTPAVWKETMMAWALLWGNACCYIERDARGAVTGLIPLLPDRTQPKPYEYITEDQRFQFMTIETLIDGKEVSFLYEDIFHIRGLATDGFWGLSAVQVCKNVIGHGMALEKHGNKLFSNGARPSGVLQHPGKLSPEARQNLRNEWNATHAGLSNANKIAILWEGMQFNPMSMSSKDAEYMDDRRFERELIASIFMLPAFKLNALENSAVRANLEEQNRDYFNTSLSRHLNKFKEEGERKLLRLGERRSGRVLLRWFPEAFLRGDTQSRFEAYSLAIANRIMSPNEVREKEDMNPYEGGDEFLNPAIEQVNRDAPATESDDNTSKEMARKLVRSQVSALLATEAKTLKKQSGPNGASNFCRWASNYYEAYIGMAENFLAIPCEIAVNSGYSRGNWKNAVETHAQLGLQSVLDLAGEVTKVGLAKAMADHADSIHNHTDSLTAWVLGEKPDA